MSFKDLFQLLRRRMKRKTDMPDQPLFFLFLNKAPEIKIIKEMRPLFPQIMQQIKIEITSTGLF